MIAYLRGTLLEKNPGQVIVDVHGVGYEVTIPVSAYSSLPEKGAELRLHIHTHVREDALSLFGFMDRNEKRLFERLITVSGVGPKLAVTILSGLDPERTVAAIRGQDHATLTLIPGVGKKLAERLVVELKEKLEDLAVATPARQPAGPAADDVLSALVNLGYQRPAAQKAIEKAIEKEKAACENFDDLFRAALKLIR